MKIKLRPSSNPNSKWWFLLPILLGAIGGVIAYFALRDDIGNAARNHLYLGIALNVIHVAVVIFGIQQIWVW